MKDLYGRDSLEKLREDADEYKAKADSWRSHAERLAEAANHFSICDYDEEVRHRCKNCQEARNALAAHAEMVKEKP